jgi:hypothetical protein
MRHYMWKAIRVDVPLKTVYAWYQPDKREAMNANGGSPRDMQHFSPRGYDPEKKDTSEPSPRCDTRSSDSITPKWATDTDTRTATPRTALS